MLKALVERYPDNVQVIYRHFPLDSIHDNARAAARASEAAALQDQFWPFHDMLYEQQGEWSSLPGDELIAFFNEQADALGMDVAQFESDFASDAVTAKLDQNVTDAANLQMSGTPTMLVDGFQITGQQIPFDVDVWASYIDETVSMNTMLENQYDAPPAMAIDTDAIYEATVTLEGGNQFVMELYPQSAPLTVNSFVFLANEGWFDGVTFHRVVPGFVAQTGDPSGTGRGGPGYSLPNEIDVDLSHSETGIVAMANSGPDTNGSQWYITLDNAAFLDGSYTIFGRVTEGFDDAVMSISPRDPADQTAPPGDRIESIVVEKQ